MNTHDPARTAPPQWRPVSGPVRHVTLTMSVPCDHCAAPIPVNGPTQLLHCDQCQRQTRLGRVPEELALAAEERMLVGSPYKTRLRRSPDPECGQCHGDVPIADYLGYEGATAVLHCPGCGAQLPTYPAPGWLRAELPNALQVFGGDPQLAREASGLAIQVEQARIEPVVMACPSCSGGLSLGQGAQRTTACNFCGSHVFIPDELWRRLHPVKTMQRWTLTYTGSLKTLEDLREEQEEREEEERWRAEQAEHERTAKRAEKRGKWIGIIGGGAGIIIAIAVVGFSFLGKGCSKVEGSFTASGKPLTDFSFSPQKCKSLQRIGAFGVALLGKDRQHALKVVEDPTKGTLIQVQIPSSCNGSTCRAVTFDREECTVFDVSVTRTSTTVNGVRLLAGHLRLDCTFKGKDAGGTARADITFKRCD